MQPPVRQNVKNALFHRLFFFMRFLSVQETRMAIHLSRLTMGSLANSLNQMQSQMFLWQVLTSEKRRKADMPLFQTGALES
jgi:hypothetical protein